MKLLFLSLLFTIVDASVVSRLGTDGFAAEGASAATVNPVLIGGRYDNTTTRSNLNPGELGAIALDNTGAQFVITKPRTLTSYHDSSVEDADPAYTISSDPVHVTHITVTNMIGGDFRFLKFYDATSWTNGTAPNLMLALPANTMVHNTYNHPVTFATALSVRCVTENADTNDVTPCSANDVSFHLSYF